MCAQVLGGGGEGVAVPTKSPVEANVSTVEPRFLSFFLVCLFVSRERGKGEGMAVGCWKSLLPMSACAALTLRRGYLLSSCCFFFSYVTFSVIGDSVVFLLAAGCSIPVGVVVVGEYLSLPRPFLVEKGATKRDSSDHEENRKRRRKKRR
jgi:hypothetical protein